MEFVGSIDDYLDSLRKLLGSLDVKTIDRAIGVLLEAYQSGSTVYVFGNGGSASTASHLVCDFNKGLTLGLDKRFDMVCLCDNMATVMAYANDCGYENVFLYPLQGKLRKGDVVIGISGSGNSTNVIRAVEYAKEKGNTVITMTGYTGGKLMKISDCPIHAPLNDMQKVEDCHLVVGHLMAQIIGKKIGHPMC